MSTFDDTGLTVDRQDEILAALFADLISAFGANSKQEARSVFGNLMNLLSESTADQNEVIEYVAGLFDPASAVRIALTRLVQLNGITRIPETKSTGTVQVTAAAGGGCTVLLGSLVSDPATDIQVKILANVVLLAGETKPVAAEAVIPGDTAISASTLTQIDTPITNWESVTNAAAFTTGQSEETDPQLRYRRQITVESPGTGNLPAIYGVLAALESTVNQKVYDNTGDAVDADGVPPGNVWCIVQGGSDAEIVEQIFSRVGGGINTFGSTTVSHPDPVTGEDYDVSFTRATEISIEVWIQRFVDPALYPANGDDLIKQAVVDYFAGDFTINSVSFRGFRIGDDVVQGLLYTPVGSIPGITSIPGIWIYAPGYTSDYSDDDIWISKSSIASIGLGNVTVSADASPGS